MEAGKTESNEFSEMSESLRDAFDSFWSSPQNSYKILDGQELGPGSNSEVSEEFV